ncbi:methionine ABC transporter ATP-binding protein [Campylobacter sp. 19-13652]|uniref:methionine ABC transporter ATP-binding protein n=1 Tax=Campylobacter sp. 19-13652 TaxID=2840180 RepID=UPI001C779056|nr:methionine ABC transporter ATP-binding protein [Campylobacter sp. 19-13652]BCX79606.1 methionine import ATP-binding protein MetN [Campylobacter sp. 19-13652]
MIKVENLIKNYGELRVIDDVSFSVARGEIFALVGHSGAGKSTLLRCLNALESYSGGSVKVGDKEVASLSGGELREFRKDIGMIFQHFALMSRKSAFENIAMPLRIWGFKDSEIRTRVGELLEIVGLSERANAYPKELSGGQKQRVAIARALALKPKILLSDEATSALDPNTTGGVLELLARINADLGISIVLVTHEMDVVKKIAHKAVLLEHGKVIGSGSVEELFLKPNLKMKEFLAEDEVLPSTGVNIRLFFPKEVAQNSVITHMARTLNIDFNIVWGKLEQLGEQVLGNLVINVDNADVASVLEYLGQSGVLYEVASD